MTGSQIIDIIKKIANTFPEYAAEFGAGLSNLSQSQIEELVASFCNTFQEKH
jgi:hypothetical protein